MSRDSAGTYTLPNPALVSGNTIESADENATRNDIASELTDSLSRSGKGGMSAAFRAADGSLAAPGISFTNDTNSGIYRIGADNWAMVCGGIKIAELTTTQFKSVFGYVPSADNSVDLGTTALRFLNAYLSGYFMDANGNELLGFSTVASAVNQLLARNAATGNPPAWVAEGGDTDIGINLVPKGAGRAQMGGSDIGFRQVPVNPQSGNYAILLTDDGKCIYHASGAGAGDTYTIPANASVAFAVGACLSFVNLDSNDLSIAITTDTMYLAGDGSTGTRTLAQYGMATAIKIASTVWVISGAGLS